METLLATTNLLKRAYWLIKLRWWAIALLAVATFFSTRILQIALPVRTIIVLCIVLLAYNYFLWDLVRYFTWKDKKYSSRTISGIINFQIGADLLILTIILHFSGGVENPFFLFFTFHMIIASITLSKLRSYLMAILAMLLFGGLLLAEQQGWLAHYPLSGLISHSLYRDAQYVAAVFGVFAATILLVVYMTTSISQQLRNQQNKLEKANEALKQKDYLKNEYVMRLTHDIKSHIVAIESCLDIVGGDMVGSLNDRQADLIHRAYQRANMCLSFITALLKLTRMKLTGQLDVDRFSLKNTLYDTIASVEIRAGKKNLQLTYDIGPNVEEVIGEQVLIEETILNLLYNAIRYTPAGGKIHITAKDTGTEIAVEVRDTGIGIPEEAIPQLFEEFFRADNARKAERGGTGLGLSIVKEVVERHGGSVWAKNNDPDPGSTFGFALPKIKAKDTAPEKPNKPK